MIEERTLVGGLIPTTFAACELHKTHRPEPDYCEEHHVIPRAWQTVWRPPSSYSEDDVFVTDEIRTVENRSAGIVAGTIVAAEKLWDPRTAVICRTGHGNVHFLLVRIMREWYETDKNSGLGHETSISAAVKRVRDTLRKQKIHFSTAEANMAKLGMKRWVDAGGSLRQLCDAGFFGTI